MLPINKKIKKIKGLGKKFYEKCRDATTWLHLKNMLNKRATKMSDISKCWPRYVSVGMLIHWGYLVMLDVHIL